MLTKRIGIVCRKLCIGAVCTVFSIRRIIQVLISITQHMQVQCSIRVPAVGWLVICRIFRSAHTTCRITVEREEPFYFQSFNQHTQILLYGEQRLKATLLSCLISGLCQPCPRISPVGNHRNFASGIACRVSNRRCGKSCLEDFIERSIITIR